MVISETIRNKVSAHEERLLLIQSPWAFASRLKKRFHLGNGEDYSVRELLEAAEFDLSQLPQPIQDLLDKKCTGVYRAGSRFQRKSICFQMYQDGPGVIHWAMNNGALMAVTREIVPGVPCLVVDDPHAVYGKMVGLYRGQHDVDVTAVVGSIGKTTTKRMISSVYRKSFEVFVDPENENQIDCVGYICQHIPKGCSHMIQEVSEDVPGSVGVISHIVKPSIAVITSIDKSHVEQFGDEEGIIKEILSITDGMNPDGVVIFSIDGALSDFEPGRRSIRVSLHDDSADVFASNVETASEGIRFIINDNLTGKSIPILLNRIYALHNVYSALYSYACGAVSGIAGDKIQEGIQSFSMAGIRQNIIRVSDDVLVYADCYNAVAKSVHSALCAAKAIPGRRRRIAVIGDIAETGNYTSSTHDEIIAYLSDSDFDLVFLLGEEITAAYARSKEKLNFDAVCCQSKKDISANLKEVIGPGDLVLFKASRSSALEDCISDLWPKEYRKIKGDHRLEIIKWRLGMVAN